MEEAAREIALMIDRVVVCTMDEDGVVVEHRPGISAGCSLADLAPHHAMGAARKREKGLS